MPTATTTEPSATSIASLKTRPGSGSDPTASAAATLRSLYPRAAKAFLQRDVALTHSLLASAFTLIHPPATAAPDQLSALRKKWDILRITFETTLYAAPPQDAETLPAGLRANLLLSPEPLVAALHSRSLHVFTPAFDAARAIQRPSAAYLPAQILVTLALAGLKLGCASVARDIIEDWLARRGQGMVDGVGAADEDTKGYAKVLEVYCLHVLPRLDDWACAEHFLMSEQDLHPSVRQDFHAKLKMLRAEAQSAAAPLPPPSPLSSTSSTPTASRSRSSSRSPSPSPSDSSHSSSSSTSTHTATPRSPHTNGRAHHGLNALSTVIPVKPSVSSQSITSERTVTPRTVRKDKGKGKARPGAAAPRSATPARPTQQRASSSSSRASSHHALTTTAADSVAAPSTFALLRTALEGMLQSITASRSRVLVYLVLFVVFPVVSFAVRLQRRRARLANAGAGAVEMAKRRLGAEGVVSRLWEETRKAVGDTVRMAGRGLV